ncbi:hypothetical protein HWV62_43072 [Athelia sp. TMB]|nr:hypothetical protein HWV62_43072 [Athelia sp. TMB]
MSLQAVVHSAHPHAIFNGAAVVLSLAALTSTPAFWPLVLTITTAHVYLTIIHRRTQLAYRLFLFWLSISIGASCSNFSSAIDALSTAGMSLIVLFGLAALQSAIALLAILIDVRVSSHIAHPWAQLLFFPALWSTAWAAVAHLSPLGRILMWSPATGAPAYAWLAPLAGPLATDWTAAAAAAVLSRLAGAWLMGPAQDADDDAQPGPLIAELDIASPPAANAKPARPRHVLTLTGVLLALAAPSFFAAPPLPVSSAVTTRVQVGCVLPSVYDKHKPDDAPLERYIAASAALANRADVLVWPESAVTFHSATERDAAFAAVRARVPGPAVGVSFEEPVPAAEGGRAGMRRNGFALVDHAGVALTYYKQHLVPVAESFALAPGSTPPALHALPLAHPKAIPPTEWSPLPDHTRPVPVTALICLDAAHPSALLSLDSRPALLLAPARTWAGGVGGAMWAQARARAAEVGAGVVWCDGGAGGLAGVAPPAEGVRGEAEAGFEYVQRGAGSFVVSVPVAWPFHDARTLYARAGAWLLVVPWAVLGAGWATDAVRAQRGARGVLAGLQRGIGGAGALVVAWRKRRGAGEEQPLLQ